jgi:hypothetical protein
MTALRDGNAILTEEFWSARLAAFDYDLVVLDPLLQFIGCDENNNTHAGVLMGAMKEWAAEETKTILLLHHATRSTQGEKVFIKPRGAGEYVNGARGVYEVSRVMTYDGRGIDATKEDYRIFTLTKDNGISYHFRDPYTKELKRELRVFPARSETPDDYTAAVREGYVRMSFADHNDERNPRGFAPRDVPFTDLHTHVKAGCCYSPYLFADGHRKNENNLGYSDVLCLDFDGEMTLAESERKFANVNALVVTTRSHGKPGKGDRFRVIIKLKTPLCIPSYDHADFMDALFEKIGSVDPATKDLGRFFFASPQDAFHYYTGAEAAFDWEPIYREAKKQKVLSEINKRRTGRDFSRHKTMTRQDQDNTLPKDTIFTGRNGSSIVFGTARETMSYGEKIQVQCRHGYGHNGGQGPSKNLAAFIAKVDSGNVYYHCSGAKCAGDGALWCED